MVFEWLMSCLKTDECIILTPNTPPPIVECHVIGQWIDTNIMKLSIHKAAGSGINEIIFPSFSWSYLFIIY